MAAPSGQTEQAARILAADLLSIGLADLTFVKPAGGIFEALEWIIDGVQDAVAAKLQHGRKQGWRTEISARSYIDVLAKILPESALTRDATRRFCNDVVDAPDVEGNAFTEVPQNHLKIRVSIEQPRRHQAQRVSAGLHREGPGGCGQPRETVVDGLARGQRIPRVA